MELQYHHHLPQLHRPFPSPLFFHYYNFFPDNHVRWTETPDSHIFSVVLPGVRKEEIRVEVENSTCMSIRTEAVDRERELAGKFGLPEMVDVNGIMAGYRRCPDGQGPEGSRCLNWMLVLDTARAA